ncbi:hypothetical protein JNUCC0626_43435 [Lentzea sp. JNUCC 0626]|uniref:hypothetical protein n=1 Tax=Lentzea sp. JNUCC 0626 TaxID=3367513 RepID=UPI0037496C78
MPNPRVVVWTTTDPDRTSAELSKRAVRPRLLVPVPHGTFVLGPEPYTAETLIDDLRIVKGRRIGLMWTESTAWLVYFDGVARLLRRRDPGVEVRPGRLVRAGATAATAGYFLDAQALVRIDGGEVDDALPHHEKKWWESFVGERNGMPDAPWVDPRLPFLGMAAGSGVLVFLLMALEIPVLITVPVCVLLAFVLVWNGAASAVVWSRVRRTDAFPVRDVLGMSAWAREADQE